MSTSLFESWIDYVVSGGRDVTRDPNDYEARQARLMREPDQNRNRDCGTLLLSAHAVTNIIRRHVRDREIERRAFAEREHRRKARAPRANARRGFAAEGGIRPQPRGRTHFYAQTALILGRKEPFSIQFADPPCRTLDDMSPEEVARIEAQYGCSCKKKAGAAQ